VLVETLYSVSTSVRTTRRYYFVNLLFTQIIFILLIFAYTHTQFEHIYIQDTRFIYITDQLNASCVSNNT
jgi:uncharacterized membrane protein YhaH (DUF805 family)